jgi:LPS-assembly lipoprotein
LAPELQTASVEGIARYSDLARALAHAFEARGSRLADTPGEASARLVILGESLTRRVLSVNAQGKATEYLLRNNVSFELRGTDDSELVAAQQVRLQRSYRFDPDQVLASANEDALIRTQMLRTAAEQIVERLNIALTP